MALYILYGQGCINHLLCYDLMLVCMQAAQYRQVITPLRQARSINRNKSVIFMAWMDVPDGLPRPLSTSNTNQSRIQSCCQMHIAYRHSMLRADISGFFCVLCLAYKPKMVCLLFSMQNPGAIIAIGCAESIGCLKPA